MNPVYIALALVAGLCIPLQAVINARLTGFTGHPMFSSFLSFAVGLAACGVLILVLRIPLPAAATMATVPAWVWTGGLLGLFFVTTTLFTVSKLGAALMIALIVAGQMLASLLLDHFNVMGTEHPLNAARIAGAALIIVGVILVKKF